MNTLKLSPRKPDLLDELNELRRSRGIAYRVGDIITLEQVHQKMKVFWINNGWTVQEAEDEYLTHHRECGIPYNQTVDLITEIKKKLLL